jgi:hypothetical protein
MDDERRRLDDLDDDEHDDGSLAIWAAFEREGGDLPLQQDEVNVDTLKARLKRGARLRAARSGDEPG